MIFAAAQAQEVIVYRSPAEKALWDCIADNPEVFLWIIGILIAIVIFSSVWTPICNWFSRTFNRRSSNRWDYHR